MLTLADLNARQGDIDPDVDLSQGQGITLDDLPFNRRIETKRFLDASRWFPIQDAYVLDIESYRLNSKVRSIQLYDISAKKVHFFVHGIVDEEVRERIKEELKNYGIEVAFHLYSTEEDLIVQFFEFLRENPKHLIGHNIAHFDLGLLNMKRQKYGVEGFRFFAHNVGAGEKEVRLFFSYYVASEEDEDLKRVPYEKRFLIVDTLYISFTLNLPSKLADLAKDSPFPKKEIDYAEFEKANLSYEAVIYSIYDVLSIPYVYDELKSRIYDLTMKYLKVEERSSQLCFEHIWEKGTGALADAYLRKLLGRVNPYVPDHQTKYFGGITRDWVNEKVFPSDGKVIRNLDFTSAYPFAVAYQGILDVLNGDFEEHVQEKYDDEVYERLLYSAVIRLKAKKTMYVLIEIDREKDKIKTQNGRKVWEVSNAFGIGFIRSFDGMEKVQDLQHEFAFLKVFRGEEFVLTKAELEMNRAFNRDFDKEALPLKIEYGLAATSREKSLEYLKLFGIRKELKSKGDPSQVAYKVLLNSCYGKLAESEGEWYNKACASAITSFVRAMLFKCLMKARDLGVKVLYSDTDSMYVKATEKQIRVLQDYSNQLNPLPKELFGEDNLKDEGEEIICFFAVKRKRYTKVILNEDGSITVVIKGGSHRDITWRHVLLNLCFLTGEFEEERIREALAKREFPEDFIFDREAFEKLCRSLYEKYKNRDLSEVFPELKTKKAVITLSRMINLRRKSSYKEGIYHYYAIQAWQNEVWRRDLRELGHIEYDRYLELKEHLDELKAERKKYERIKSSKWQQFYELLKNELYNGSYGEWFADSGISQEYAYYFRQLANRLNIKVNLNDSRFFLYLFEKLKEYSDLRELINSISPDTVTVEDYQDVGEYLAYLDREIEKAEGELEELEVRVQQLAKVVKKEQPYIGLFFEVWKGYRFEEYYDDILEDTVFSLNYELYAVQPKVTPVIWNRDYMEILFRKLEIDTIAFLFRESINLQKLDPIDKKKFTKACYSLPHNGKVRHDALADYALHIRLRLNGYNDLDEIEVLNKNKKAYANTELFLTPQRIFYGAFRINKWRMLDEQTDIFRVYYVAVKLQNLMRLFIEEQFRKNGVEVEVPRFSICYQIDVSQKSDENFAFEVYKAKWGKPFYTWSINKTQGLQLTKYLEWTLYPKAESVKQKLQHEELTEREKEYFLREAEEGWRSEIKFRLKRNIDIVLSYAYVLNALDHRSLLNFVKNSNSYYNGVMSEMRKSKAIEVNLSTRYNGIFIFGRDKVKVMWLSEVMWEGHILKSSIREQPPSLDPLEGHGLNVEQRPPHCATLHEELKGKERLVCIWQIRPDDKEFVNFEAKEMNRLEKLQRTGYVECIRD